MSALFVSSMKTSASPDFNGDLGHFIKDELNKRRIPLPKTGDLPRLPATWRTWDIDAGNGRRALAVRAQGCSLDCVVAMLFSLLSPSRVQRAFSKDNDRSFWFSVDGKRGSFNRTDTGLVVSFITCAVTLTIGQDDQEVHIGFSEHPK